MKSMKKMVLVGLVLLASVMVLVGCKMEPEGPQGQKVYKFTSEPRILSDYKSPNNTDSEWTYVAFGDWPQTIKDKDVIVDETKGWQMGMFTYYLGSDGNYYVKVTTNPYEDGYKYSDESVVEEGEEVYFKVEPIVWRVLNAKDGKYNESENPLLLAENILTVGIEWDDSKNNYQESNIRKWLNGNSSDAEESDYNGYAGFLQTAFTKTAGNFIVQTIVDNSAQSTNPDSNDKQWNSGVNQNASETKTKDKIFLLSEQEATMSDYGFAEYTASGQGNTRIRVTTDYAKAAGAFQSGTTGYGGIWWLRSPLYVYSCFLNAINGAGSADFDYNLNGITSFGIVPALSISINGN